MAVASAAPAPQQAYPAGVGAVAPGYGAPGVVPQSYLYGAPAPYAPSVPSLYSPAPYAPSVPSVYSAAPVVSSSVYPNYVAGVAPYEAASPVGVSASSFVSPVSYGSGFFPHQYSNYA